jgi:hypothetical protein
MFVKVILFISVIALGQHVTERVQDSKSQPTTVEKKQSNEKTTKISNAEGNKTTPSLCSGCLVKAQPQAPSDPRNSYDPRNDALYRWYLRATVAGVAGGFIGIGLLFWQVILLRRSTNAATDAAKTSTATAEALKSSERAHVGIELTSIRPAAQGFSFAVTHFGRSRALITYFELSRYFFSKDVLQIPDDLSGFKGHILYRKLVNQLLPVGQPTTLYEFRLNDNRPADEAVFYKAAIIYQDIFEEEHRTDVVYRSDGKTLTSAPRYNKFT